MAYVQIYSDDSNEGQTYHGQAIVNHTTNTWQYTGVVTGPNVTALGFDGSSNTSEFSSPFKVDDFDVFLILPAIIKAAKTK